MTSAAETTIAIDGLPASPAMAAALAGLAASGAAMAARRTRIDTDPVIMALRAENAALRPRLAYGMPGAVRVFASMVDGSSEIIRRNGELIRARIAELDRAFPFPRSFGGRV